MTTEPLVPAALFRLQAWLSPSFPVGAFSYSHGLEWLVETGVVHDEDSLAAFVCDLITIGGGRCDAIFLAAAYEATRRADFQELEKVVELAAAFCPSAERYLETTGQGMAFLRAVQNWQSPTLDKFSTREESVIAYPVAVAVATADHEIPLDGVLLSYLHAFASNIISAGLRLIPLGQTSGQRVTLAIEDAIRNTAERAHLGLLDELGSGLLLADVASMLHETQYSRLFRS